MILIAFFLFFHILSDIVRQGILPIVEFNDENDSSDDENGRKLLKLIRYPCFSHVRVKFSNLRLQLDHIGLF